MEDSMNNQPASVVFNPDTDTGIVPSPCIGVCRMDQQAGWCEGCFRTLDELRQWSTASDDSKRAIWRLVLKRQDDYFDGVA
jgi:uncharacterized protein